MMATPTAPSLSPVPSSSPSSPSSTAISPFSTLPTSLLYHLTRYLSIDATFAHLAHCNSSIHRTLLGNLTGLRTFFDERIVDASEGERNQLPMKVKQAIRGLSIKGKNQTSDARIDMRLDPLSLPLASIYPSLHTLQIEDVSPSMESTPYKSLFLNDAGMSWSLRSFTFRSDLDYPSQSGARSMNHCWLMNILPLWSHSLRHLELFLPSHSNDPTGVQELARQVECIVKAKLAGLEILKLEQQEGTEVEGDGEDDGDGDKDSDDSDENDKFNPQSPPSSSPLRLDRYSESGLILIQRLFHNSPNLHTLHLSFFHPDLIFTHHQLLPSLRTLHYTGEITFASLSHLAQLSTLQYLLLDFTLDSNEFQRNWLSGRLVFPEVVHPLQQTGDSVNKANHQYEPNYSLPSSSIDLPPSHSDIIACVNRHLFTALSHLTELLSLQLQSTNGEINYCLVPMRNFVLLRTLAKLTKLQFSCFLPASTPMSASSSNHSTVLSDELERLCRLIPSLTEVIWNIERPIEDDDDDQQQARLSSLSFQSSISPSSLSSSNDAHPLHLKKLGFWDGMATPNSVSHCIMKNLDPFLASHPNLHALSLIYCQLSTLRPLERLGESLVSLCLYQSHTYLDDENTSPHSPASSSPCIGLDQTVSLIGSLTHLGWLILNGTGSFEGSLSVHQLVAIGRVIDMKLIRLKNFRLENQPNMTSQVWKEWFESKEKNIAPTRFNSLRSLSFKDCQHLGLDGHFAIMTTLIESFDDDVSNSNTSRRLADLLDLNLLGTYTPAVDGAENLDGPIVPNSATDISAVVNLYQTFHAISNSSRNGRNRFIQLRSPVELMGSQRGEYNLIKPKPTFEGDLE